MTPRVILCVDDEESILRSLRRCFSSEGYTFLMASSGQEALDILGMIGGKIDLLIIDQKMPEMMGDEFLRIVHEKYGCFPVIMLSGYAEIEALSRAESFGEVVHFVAKPWINQELRKRVQDILGAV